MMLLLLYDDDDECQPPYRVTRLVQSSSSIECILPGLTSCCEWWKELLQKLKPWMGVLFCCYYPPDHAPCLYSPVSVRLLMLLLFRWRSLWKNGKVPTWCCCCQCNTDIRGNYYSSCSSNLCHSVLSTARKLCILKRMVYSVLNFKH